MADSPASPDAGSGATSGTLTDTTAPDHLLYGRARTIAFATIALGMLLAALDTTIVSTALPTIVGDLGGSEHVSWVVTAYLLAQTVSAAVVGKLGDLFGRKRVFQSSVVVFIVGSALCGLADDMTWLISSRALQGIGAGGLTVTSTALIADIISLRDRGRYQGSLGAVFGVTTVLGPLLGGLFTDNLDWRWVFYINVPFAILVLIVANRTLPVSERKHGVKIDLAGAATVAVGAASLILATSWGGGTYAWGSWQIIGLFVLGILGLIAFVFAELRAADPILPMDMFRQRTFAVCCVLSFIVGFTMLGAMTFLPTFLQYVDGVSATASGLRMLPMVLGLLLTSISVGLVVSRTGRYRAFPIVGALVMAAGLLLLSRMNPDTPVWQSSLAMFVLGLGIGLSMQVLTIVVQNVTPYARLGSATSSVTFLRTMGSAFGTAVFGTLYSNELSGRLTDAIVATDGAVTAADATTPTALHSLSDATIAPVLAAYADTLDRVFLSAAPVALLAFVIALALPAGRLRLEVQPQAGDLGESFGAPDARSSAERLAQRVANVMYAHGRDGVQAVLTVADLPFDGSRAWALMYVRGLRSIGEPASATAIARGHRIPVGLLKPAFDELRERGLIDGDAEDLHVSEDGMRVLGQLRDALETWVRAELGRSGEVSTADLADLDVVLDDIVSRVMREEVSTAVRTPRGRHAAEPAPLPAAS